ncbi:transglycosylase SLT domain-containing protein [Streptomyces abyssomicinicus]|uniref:transglycosylase SLT domain-containing protein n=1 Tax=Streptomyces abyssomicinicus TaxID=574929 RepID=UPI00124FF4F6|nr:transglycosylase SLT domain-containing protein [Streptomyces abyssomicinicus]
MSRFTRTASALAVAAAVVAAPIAGATGAWAAETPATAKDSATAAKDSAAAAGNKVTQLAATPDNLDAWINEALDVMEKHDIPGTYEGIHRNVMRESSGNPLAINDWDINAVNGIPSKGLLQVIDPTFDEYHVEGTGSSPFDPVANIAAACNYAADRYGSIDNVNSAY